MASIYARRLKDRTTWYARIKDRAGKWLSLDTKIDAPARKRGEDEFTWRQRAAADSSAEDAREFAAIMEENITAGRDPFSTNTNAELRISALGVLYCEFKMKAGDWSPRTLPLHELSLKMLADALGDIPVTSIGKDDIAIAMQHFRDNRPKKSAPSPATVNLDLRNVAAFLRWVHDEIEPAGWTLPKIPKLKDPKRSLRDYYTPAEVRKLLKTAVKIEIHERDNFGQYLAVLLLTGLRKREALRMEWEKIDRRARLVSIRGKRGHIETIPLTTDLSRLLKCLPQPHRGSLWRVSAWSGYIDDCWNQAVSDAGIRRLKLHNLRDTFAVNMLLEGLPLAVVSRMLRHASINTTMSNYAAFSMEDIGRMLSRGKPTQKPGTFATAVLQEVCK